MNRPIRPHLTWWTDPRQTIRNVVDYNPNYLVAPLVMAGGIFQALDSASANNSGDQLGLHFILGFALIIGPLAGYLGLLIWSSLLAWTGKWVGGINQKQNIKAAIAWSQVALIPLWGLWLVQLIIFGDELFTTETPLLDANPILTSVYVGFGLIHLVVGIWAISLFLRALSEVQQFSIWKAVANALLAGGAFLAAIIALTLPVLLLSAN